MTIGLPRCPCHILSSTWRFSSCSIIISIVIGFRDLLSKNYSERLCFPNNKSLATMVYLLYILTSQCDTYRDTAFNLATICSMTMPLYFWWAQTNCKCVFKGVSSSWRRQVSKLVLTNFAAWKKTLWQPSTRGHYPSMTQLDFTQHGHF